MLPERGSSEKRLQKNLGHSLGGSEKERTALTAALGSDVREKTRKEKKKGEKPERGR